MEPINVSLILAESRCSLNCVFCSGKPMGDIEKNVEFELEKLRGVVEEREVESVEVSGNDPAEYEGLPDFVSEINEIADPQFITISTHGGMLSDQDYFEKLLESGMTTVRIPIYGATEEVHDAVTGTKGSFDNLLECFHNMADAYPDIIVDVTSLVLRENQGHLRELFYVFSQLDFAHSFRLALPSYVKSHARFADSVPDFDKLREDLPKALKYALSRGLKVNVADLPYCVVGFDYPHMAPSPRGYKAYEYRKDEPGMEVIDGEVVPKYLRKTKSKKCSSCIYDARCEGIFEEYVNTGDFTFHPVED